MRFRSHQCWFPRDVEFPREYEDASARSEKQGRALVADGVSSAIFSRDWARLLTRAAVVSLPDLESEEAIQAWLGPLQQQWRKGINFAGLPWHQKPKATSVGAQTTLLAVSIEPFVDGEAPPGAYRLRASGIGDCVLFLIREGRKLFSFPLAAAAEFAEPPQVFSSIAKGISYADKFRHLDDRCHAGDLLAVCSDAVGLWAMEEYEAGREVDWMRYWDNDQAWQDDIQRLRAKRPDEHGNRMRVDDCTLLLLQVIAEELHADEPDVQPDRSDEAFVLVGATAQIDASGIDAGDAVASAAGSPQPAISESPAACTEIPIEAPIEAPIDGSTGPATGSAGPTLDESTLSPDALAAMPDGSRAASETRQTDPTDHGFFSRLRRLMRGESDVRDRAE